MRTTYTGAIAIVASWLVFFVLFWAGAQGFLTQALQAFQP